MASKIHINEDEFLKIRNLYLKEKLTTKQISKILPYSFTFITESLKRQNSYINTNNISKEGFEKSDLKKEIFRLKEELLKKDFVFLQNEDAQKNDKIVVAVCKKTGEYFLDYKNSSGSLTNHLKLILPKLVHPTNFKKREYQKKNNQFWHEQYFDITEIPGENLPIKKCKYCDWKTIDVDNRSGMYMNHLKNKHNIQIEEYLKKFPEEELCFKKQSIIQQKEKIKNIENINYVICKICNNKFRKISNSHLLKKHGITAEEYKTKFSNSLIVCEETKKFSIDTYNKVLKYKENKYTSASHQEIADFIKSFNIDIKMNDKKLLKGLEIDILIPEFKLGIEFNGCLYHSEIFGKKDKKYHLNKTELMNKEGYFLIHIFEDEWLNKKEIVKSKILYAINKSCAFRIHTRKCVIKEIDSSLKNLFLEKNHIQGKNSSVVNLGAFYNDDLVSVMTFDNGRGMSMNKTNNKNYYELDRFCVNNSYSANGIANKMIKFFIKNYNPKKIISFADRRWTLDKNNNLYIKLGFKLLEITPPVYSYFYKRTHEINRHHRFAFGKSSLKKKFPEIYDENKTEWQMMQELGYDRIWDCGKFKYEMNF